MATSDADSRLRANRGALIAETDLFASTDSSVSIERPAMAPTIKTKTTELHVAIGFEGISSRAERKENDDRERDDRRKNIRLATSLNNR